MVNDDHKRKKKEASLPKRGIESMQDGQEEDVQYLRRSTSRLVKISQGLKVVYLSYNTQNLGDRSMQKDDAFTVLYRSRC